MSAHWSMPWRAWRSEPQIPQRSTTRRTCPERGAGSGPSTTSKTACSQTTDFIASGPEPPLAASRAELLLLRRELLGGLEHPRRRRRTAEEVGLYLSDHPASELDVAIARALVGRRRLTSGETRGDVVGHDARRGLGEHARLRHRQAGHVAQGIDVRKAGREVGLVDGHPSVDREPGPGHHVRRAVDGYADEEVVGHGLAACQPSLAIVHVEAPDELLGRALDSALVQ